MTKELTISEIIATATRCLASIEREEKPIVEALARDRQKPGLAVPVASSLGAWKRQLKKIIYGLEQLQNDT